jgi:hypothetical protein
MHSQAILDLDWNSTPDMQSILAVGFSRHVELLCQQRMTYFDEGPGWALCHRIDISAYVFIFLLIINDNNPSIQPYTLFDQ